MPPTLFGQEIRHFTHILTAPRHHHLRFPQPHRAGSHIDGGHRGAASPINRIGHPVGRNTSLNGYLARNGTIRARQVNAQRNLFDIGRVEASSPDRLSRNQTTQFGQRKIFEGAAELAKWTTGGAYHHHFGHHYSP